MIPLTAAEVADATGGRLGEGTDPATTVTADAVVDSRLARPGSLFVAVAGESSDGHDYAGAAFGGGAALALASRPVAGPHVLVEDTVVALGELARAALARLRERGTIRVVGITGSVGKTSTKDLLGQVLAEHAPTVAPVASFNNEIGLPLTVLRADEATRFLVLEMGASGIGHIEYLTRIAPLDVAVVLMVGHAHLGGFGGIEAVARAKAEIVAGLVPTGTAVLNVDDVRVAAMAQEAPSEVVFFGAGDEAHIRALDIALDPGGRARFTLHAQGERHPVALLVVGEHHVSNALAVASAAIALGIPPHDTARALGQARAISPHRMQVVERADGVTIIDDAYNANPDSTRAALKALAAMAGADRRSVAVLGEMLELGEESDAAHGAVGRLAVDLAIDRLVVVGEGAAPIAEGARGTGMREGDVVQVSTVDAAADLLAAELGAGDVVLVKSSHGSGLWQLGDSLSAREATAGDEAASGSGDEPGGGDEGPGAA
jgi:UDP-N-acetylmuramoyl-tripeptide--D-alanyl-D-alanine ligase